MKKKIIICSIIVLILVTGLITSLYLKNQNKDNKDLFDDAIFSVITMDVNPSIEIALNKNEEVISVKALNEDSKKIIEGKDFKKEKIENVLPVIVNELKNNNYLSEIYSNMLLVNVDTSDTKLLNKVKEEVEKISNENKIKIELVMQNIKSTSELEKIASDNNISVSKAYYIEEMIKDKKDLTIESFKDTSINDIKKEVESKTTQEENKTTTNNKTSTNTNTNTNKGRTGSMSKCEKVPVGLSNDDAANKAVNDYGAKLNPAGYCDVRSASSVASMTSDGTCAYEVKFSYRNNSCTYYINISTGDIVTKKCINRNIDMGDNQCIIMKDLNIKHRENLQLENEIEKTTEFVSTVFDGYGTMNTYEYHVSKSTGKITEKKMIKEFDGPAPYNESNPRPDDI